MQSPITLPPLVIRPDSPLPNPPGPTPGYIAKPIPWNGTTIEVAEFDNFFKRNDIRYERLTLSVIFTIATLQKSIEESYTGYSSNLTPALDSEINTFIGTGALSPLDWMKTAKYVIDLLAEKSKNDLASNTATANIFYGRHPFNKDIKKNAVDFVNILQIPGNKEPSIDIYKKWTTSITAAYQEKLLPERIRILTEKSHLLTASIAAVEAQEQQDIWRALAAWSIRYNDSKKPIIHQYNVDKSNVVQRIQSELDRAVLEIGPSTALTSVQLANKRIITAKQLIDEKDRALQIHISLLANYPDRDFKKTDLNDFLERSTTYNPPNSELAFVDEVNAIKSAYGADVLMDEISSLQAHLPTLYAAHAKAEAELIVAANLFRLPGVIAATRPVITTSTGTIAVIEGAALTLQTAIRIAITSLTDFLASVSPGFFVGVAALIYSPKLANGELPEQYAFSTPLSDLIPNQEKDLEAIATAGGTVELPYRISSKTAADGRSEAFVVKTDGVFVPSKVKVVSTVYNTNQNLYTATTTDTPPRTLTWTPIVNPETNPTTSPAASPVPAIYTGATVTPVQGRIDTFPAVSEGSFDDYVLVFPTGSGLPPLYVMFRDRREDPGIALGLGVPASDNWLDGASQGEGVPIPSHIADQLRGKEFKNFRAFRETFWKTVANDPMLSIQFDESTLKTMIKGRAPIAREREQVGNRIKIELHHKIHISTGGDIYSLDNIYVITPKLHINTHRSRPL